MLQACMDQKLFLYGMIAAGILGIWCLFWSNRFYHSAVRDMKRRKTPRGRWTAGIMELYRKREVPVANSEAFIRDRLHEARILKIRVGSLLNGVNLAVSLCGAFLLLGIWCIYLFQYETYVLYQYLLLSGSIISALLLLRFSLNMKGKEQRLVDGWVSYLENSENHAVRAEAIQAAAVRAGAAQAGTVRTETGQTGAARSEGVRTGTEAISGEALRQTAAQTEAAQVVELEKKRKLRVEKKPDKRSDQEAAITRVEEKIREKAGPRSKFSEILNPEDEKLMREVIREYLT